MLSPHLVAGFRNTHAFEDLAKERDFLSETASKGLIVLSQARSIIFINDRAVRLLKGYFPEFDRDQLPEDIYRFVEQQNAGISGNEYFEPAETLRIRKQNSELRIRLIFDFSAKELRLMLEEVKELAFSDLLPLGLSGRESEILLWVCRGKADSVIGRLCGISVRTVQKHVENILVKLGVETRTNAAAIAFEKIGRD